jgi:hypothetical protein
MRYLPLFLTLLAVPDLPATEIQVSHELTLSQALQQLREARKSGDTSPATIRLPKGKLDITQPLMLEAQDSDLTFIGTDSTLIGGPKVTGWEKHTREIVKADVSKLLPKGFLPKQLLCDGERQISPAIRTSTRRTRSTGAGLLWSRSTCRCSRRTSSGNARST